MLLIVLELGCLVMLFVQSNEQYRDSNDRENGLVLFLLMVDTHLIVIANLLITVHSIVYENLNYMYHSIQYVVDYD